MINLKENTFLHQTGAICPFINMIMLHARQFIRSSVVNEHKSSKLGVHLPLFVYYELYLINVVQRLNVGL